MSTYRPWAAGCLALALTVTTQAAATSPAGGDQASASGGAHTRAFWRSIIDHEYAIPPGASLRELSAELGGLVSSPDPELRDEICYSILTAWIFQQRTLDPDAMRPLIATWLANLTIGIGQTGTDTVLRRSFSALMLSVVAARDNEAPFLAADEFATMLDRALEYLRAERDLRGYDEAKGWIHSAAHTADLIKFLGRGRHLKPDDPARILDAVSSKLRDASLVFTFGEDERLARAVLPLILRADFNPAPFRAWVERNAPPPLAARPTAADLRGRQNVKNLFAKLEVLLTLQVTASEPVLAARGSLRDALKKLF